MSPTEVEKFDVDELVGRSAHITVIHEHSDGEVYANIALITPDKSAEPLKASGKFVRMKDRPPKDGAGAQGGGYRRAEPAGDTGGDLLATKIHVGKCKGLEVRDLSPEQVGALVANWLPAAKANAKPTADDKRLIAALEYWHTANAGKSAEDDDVPY